MKAKNKKCGVFAALTAALMVTAALITSCPAEVITVYRDGYQPPAGEGYIRINAPEFNGERTVLPSAPSAWEEYKIEIQQYTALGSGGTTIGSAITRNNVTNLSTPINLAPGFYELTVTANTDAGAAAQGTSSRFQIDPGAGKNVSVTIRPLPFSETGNGKFEYSINFNSILATAEMTITAIKEGGGYAGTAQTVTEGPGSATLAPGSYRVFLEATVGTEKASIIEIVNIHQNLTSTVNFDLQGSYFVASVGPIEITFTPEDVKPALTKNLGTPTVTESTTINLSLAGTEAVTITITITNEPSFPGGITYYCGGNTPVTVTGGTFTIAANTAPFTKLITYPVTVVGQTANGAHSTNFKIQIVN
jgi:hypothetical protein